MDTGKTQKIYSIIMTRLDQLIKEQNLQPGDRIPSERDLATQLSVSRASVHQAIAAQVAKGLLESRQGDGTYIRRTEEPGRTLQQLGESIAREQISPIDIDEARLLIECESARLCALKADAKTCEKLKSLLERHRIATGTDTSLEVMNHDLHQAIAEGSGNRALEKLQNCIWEMLAGNMWQYLKKSVNNRIEMVRLHLDQHEEIVAAICEHDSEKAARKMREHLTNIKENMSEVMDSYQK